MEVKEPFMKNPFVDINTKFSESKQNRATTKKKMDENSDDFVRSTENENQRSYLLTYSQADIQKFPNCSTFSEYILHAFPKVRGPSKNRLVVCRTIFMVVSTIT